MDQLKFEGNCINIKMHKFLNKYISNNINTLAPFHYLCPFVSNTLSFHFTVYLSLRCMI